jgi:hypothetical protein
MDAMLCMASVYVLVLWGITEVFREYLRKGETGEAVMTGFVGRTV